MKIYKVCTNFLKGIQEVEIIKINDDNTFTYERDLGWTKRIVCRDFKSRHPNDSNYFKTRKKAKDFISEKISKAIQKSKALIQKYELLQNEL